MSQSQTQSILSAQPYRNPRHEQEAAELEEYDKSIREGQAREPQGTDKEAPEHNWEKRYKDLQSYTAKKINMLENEKQALAQQGIQKIQIPKTQEELEAFKAQNPETYAVIQSMAGNLFKEYTEQYDQKIAKMQGDLTKTTQERAKLALKEAHPDFETIMNSDAFHDWAATQTTEVQDWIYKNPDNAEKAIKALSLFKYESGWGKQTNSQDTHQQGGGDIDVAVSSGQSDPTVVGRNHPAYLWKESEIAQMRPDEFAKWDESITLAQSEGRILLGQ